jgi:hypothetical protein
MEIGEQRVVPGNALIQALTGDYGVFRVTSPSGEVFQAVSEPGHSLTQLTPRGVNAVPPAGHWSVEKISQEIPRSLMSQGAGQGTGDTARRFQNA